MAQAYTNNASALLSTSVDLVDLTLQVDPGFGALFPSTATGDYFLITIEDVDGNYEICKVTDKTGDIFTVLRGQEGTSPKVFAAGSRVECRITAGTMQNLLPLSGGIMQGPLSMNGNDFTNANIDASTIDNSVIANSPVRGEVDVTSNEFVVPTGGAAPTIGGNEVWHAGNLDPDTLPFVPAVSGVIVMWYGVAGAVPSGWVLCDGENDTPDLRDRFVVGAGGSLAPTHLSSPGGATSAVSTFAGSHDHGGVTGTTVLTEANLPEHTHSVWASDASGADIDPLSSFNAGFAGSQDGLSAYIEQNGSAVNLLGSGGSPTPDGHSHTITLEGEHAHVTSTLPPYKGIYFIMKL